MHALYGLLTFLHQILLLQITDIWLFIIPRRVLTHGGNHKTATFRACVRTESDLGDGWMESNDILDSDGESPDTSAHLLKVSNFSFLRKLGHFFINFQHFLGTCVSGCRFHRCCKKFSGLFAETNGVRSRAGARFVRMSKFQIWKI